ncbi:MAG: Uma2 family endonuclease [Pyrinomonadaceae bacterium]
MSAVLETIPTKRKNVSPNVVERVVLHGISWETYERILNEHNEVSNRHFAYNEGDLEIMVLGYEHERLKQDLSELITEIARILQIDYQGAASTTFRKESKKKGFEGDATFYFENAETIRRKTKIDLSKDPSPELVVEIDITHGSLSKFPIFSDLGIEEIWRFDGESVKFHRLQDKSYKEISESVCLKNVKSEIVTELLFAASEMKRIDWIKLIHKTIKEER